ncbi:PQQ-dependent sugar dehydrogenase [Streptomyces sp. WAC 00631]|uniref:PQQ-dependent sugar dehydrogenase n=1 Tax=unclassified Streptomyces TaxID=2593676 RepID=UPI000F79FDAE|nr:MULTISPECIES: PQQ-dependent sugar dehydrogenase [unclassified Streptomyces]MCC5033613.1 PQQ-dependent sugar dehydrogenase [Streptomyces sp. WAC 00631]MCC9742993.1 PQQ-dependent sugar dehydrogenase [Streptomyces sp. MNU89]
MPRGKRISRLLLALTLTAAVAPVSRAAESRFGERDPGPGVAAAAEAAPLEDLTVTTTQVASGLRRPTAIASPDDATGRLFITEKAGTVRVYHPDTGLATEPLLDLTGRVNANDNERGLLGIAPAPDFEESQLLYVAYTRRSDDAVTLARVDVREGGVEELLTQEHAQYSNHNGGHLAFGPDGYLYWSIGDGGGSGDPFDSGQRLDTLLGKILRLDVGPGCRAGSGSSCVPADNPFVDRPGARPEIWAYGLRNPWRFSLDEADGSLWIGDVGQGSWEEVDHLAADEGGANLGWSCMEGPEVLNADQCDPDADYTDPVFSYPSSVGGCSVIGGPVYRGEEFAELAGGTYLATDYCSSTVWGIRPGPDGYANAEIGEFPTQVTSFGEDETGELYVANDLPGGLHRVSFGTR